MLTRPNLASRKTPGSAQALILKSIVTAMSDIDHPLYGGGAQYAVLDCSKMDLND
jgi:hypothetical protein